MANLRNGIYSMLLKPIAFSLNIFLKIAVIKVADDCIADSAEFAEFGRFATEVSQRYQIAPSGLAHKSPSFDIVSRL